MSGTIVLKQQPTVLTDRSCCPSEEAMVCYAPQWEYVSPLPDMETKGLTPEVLREIIDGINERSKKYFTDNIPPKECKGKIRWIQLILFLLGVIIMIDSHST